MPVGRDERSRGQAGRTRSALRRARALGEAARGGRCAARRRRRLGAGAAGRRSRALPPAARQSAAGVGRGAGGPGHRVGARRLAAVRRTAHTLKGSSATLGVLPLATEAATLEQAPASLEDRAEMTAAVRRIRDSNGRVHRRPAAPAAPRATRPRSRRRASRRGSRRPSPSSASCWAAATCARVRRWRACAASRCPRAARPRSSGWRLTWSASTTPPPGAPSRI